MFFTSVFNILTVFCTEHFGLTGYKYIFLTVLKLIIRYLNFTVFLCVPCTFEHKSVLSVL